MFLYRNRDRNGNVSSAPNSPSCYLIIHVGQMWLERGGTQGAKREAPMSRKHSLPLKCEKRGGGSYRVKGRAIHAALRQFWNFPVSALFRRHKALLNGHQAMSSVFPQPRSAAFSHKTAAPRSPRLQQRHRKAVTLMMTSAWDRRSPPTVSMGTS